MEPKDKRTDDKEASPAMGVRKRRVWLLFLPVMLTLWVVITTEMRVADLRSQGFSEVVIDSERNHAYFPLVGGLFGAAVSIALVRCAKRLFRRRQGRRHRHASLEH